jgi:homocysteine S-methyltransferase
MLITHPEAIQLVHESYLESGADCLISSTYQASIQGFVSEGVTETQARKLLRLSVDLAVSARDRFLSQSTSQSNRSLYPMVAASIGPYGAFLADGSEYIGNYGISSSELKSFHESRWEILIGTNADLFACETIPSLTEAKVLLELFAQTPNKVGWISFTCRDEKHISDGTPISDCAAAIEESDQILAIGVNCTRPSLISSLIEQIRKSAPAKEIVVYPNSGEQYNGYTKRWSGNVTALDFGKLAVKWHQQGARILGGCCRTAPDHVKTMRRAVLENIS